MKIQKPWHQHSKESSRTRRGQSYTCSAAYASLVVHVRSREKGKAAGETRDWLRGNTFRAYQCSRLYGELMEIMVGLLIDVPMCFDKSD